MTDRIEQKCLARMQELAGGTSDGGSGGAFVAAMSGRRPVSSVSSSQFCRVPRRE